MLGEQLSFPSTQLDPYQNPRAYELSIAKNKAPIPAPAIAAYLVAFLVTY